MYEKQDGDESHINVHINVLHYQATSIIQHKSPNEM